MIPKILIAELQPLFREILEVYLKERKDVKLFQSAKSRSELLRKIKKEKLDILIVDIFQYPEEIALLDMIREACPAVKIVLLSFCREQAKVLKALNRGVQVYLTKDAEPARLIEAIDAAEAGEDYCFPAVSELMRKDMEDLKILWDDAKRMDSLTRREKEVIGLIARGYSNLQIAEELNISDKTVKNHVAALLKKMRFQDRTQAAIFFLHQR
ncbi:MAG: response regulator transcription factor [Peptostreptococcaceae bacterium]|nr:response regulator transcription factor [Peptostreptococcaceae bacterium]